jgi:hypothetical protein
VCEPLHGAKRTKRIEKIPGTVFPPPLGGSGGNEAPAPVASRFFFPEFLLGKNLYPIYPFCPIGGPALRKPTHGLIFYPFCPCPKKQALSGADTSRSRCSMRSCAARWPVAQGTPRPASSRRSSCPGASGGCNTHRRIRCGIRTEERLELRGPPGPPFLLASFGRLAIVCFGSLPRVRSHLAPPCKSSHGRLSILSILFGPFPWQPCPGPPARPSALSLFSFLKMLFWKKVWKVWKVFRVRICTRSENGSLHAENFQNKLLQVFRRKRGGKGAEEKPLSSAE